MLKLIEIPSPSSLKIANKPLSNADRITEEKNILQLKNQFNFHYEENISFPEGFNSEKLSIEMPNSFLVKITERLHYPLNDSLVVCHISEEVGYGVFTTQPIPMGTIIGIYAGQVESAINEAEYGMSIPSKRGWRINAGSQGGITRFIQHLPYTYDVLLEAIDEAENFASLQEIRFIHSVPNCLFPNPDASETLNDFKVRIKASIKNCDIVALRNDQLDETYAKKTLIKKIKDNNINIAFANIMAKEGIFNNKPIIYFVACRPIGAHEQLGISYGFNYWLSKKNSPRFFTKSGDVIEKSLYLANIERIKTACKKSTAQEAFLDVASSYEGGDSYEWELVSFLDTDPQIINYQHLENRYTALFMAVATKNKDCQETLGLYQANWDIKDKNGLSPRALKSSQKEQEKNTPSSYPPLRNVAIATATEVAKSANEYAEKTEMMVSSSVSEKREGVPSNLNHSQL